MSTAVLVDGGARAHIGRLDLHPWKRLRDVVVAGRVRFVPRSRLTILTCTTLGLELAALVLVVVRAAQGRAGTAETVFVLLLLAGLISINVTRLRTQRRVDPHHEDQQRDRRQRLR